MRNDGISALQRPRRRRLLSVIAVIIPFAALVGAVALFLHTHVMPLTVAVPQSMVLAAANGSSPPARPQPETTGASVRIDQSLRDIGVVMLPMVGTLAFAPLSQPATVSVPMPPPRPRVADGGGNGVVPLPRPRPPL
jgi:hypothetical protein